MTAPAPIPAERDYPRDPDALSKLVAAASDPSSPIYGSDLVPWVDDVRAEVERLQVEFEEKIALLDDQNAAEVAALRARLCEMAPWSCPCCGDHIKVDEDGCCASCGEDALHRLDPRAALAGDGERGEA